MKSHAVRWIAEGAAVAFTVAAVVAVARWVRARAELMNGVQEETPASAESLQPTR